MRALQVWIADAVVVVADDDDDDDSLNIGRHEQISRLLKFL